MRLLSFIFITFLFLFGCKPNKKEQTLKVDTNKVAFDAIHGNLTDFKTITFPSKDGLTITADLYLVKEPKDFILLCHQAGFSRGEYIEAAKKLNNLGYSCVAIDQRSGKIANNVINETAKRAKEKGLSQKYLDAKQDIEAAIEYTYKLNKSNAIILVGSSYSASLSLYITTKNDKIKAVAAFSPGEYLKGINVTNYITDLDKPVFVTSSKKEIAQVAGVISKVISSSKTQFKPTEEGIHGSRMLWKKTKGSQDCWKSFEGFLNQLK